MCKTKRILPVLLLLLLVSACRRQPETEVPAVITLPEEISAYGIKITKDSTSQEVARLLIAGLDNRDEVLLKKLAAVEYVKREVDDIFGRHTGKSETTFEQAAGFAVDRWITTYAIFRKGQTYVSSTNVSGDTATVIATGSNKSTGEIMKISIPMRKEKGWWKVEHGVNSL